MTDVELGCDNAAMDISSEDSATVETHSVSFDGEGLHSPKVATVIIRNAVKSFVKGKNILHNFNMTVPRGTIYGLLGASGCGKTTVLSCIVGMKHLNRGEISVFGQKPGTKESGVPGKRVGYMPQEYALYSDFTIAEILWYFGCLYGMESADVKASGEFLQGFLELPEFTQKIGCMSGGQKRRVSLAVALIHSPELLILDEPTVGVDPLLRENIWNHLVKLVSTENTTIIITTHYIEEARQSNTIGLMRDGKLLAEKSPIGLLQEYKTNSLEDIVLQLCKKQAMGLKSQLIHAEHVPYKQQNKGGALQSRRMSWAPPEHFYDASNGFRESLTRIKALALKNKGVMTGNIILLLFMITMPPIQTFIMGTAIGHDPKPLNFGVVNYETMNSTSCFSRPRDVLEGCNIEDLSCQFLYKLPEDVFHLHEHSSEEKARKAVTQGEQWGYLVLPPDLSGNFLHRATSCAQADNDTLVGSRISITMDMSNSNAGMYAKQKIYEAFADFTKALLIDCGFNPESGESPIQYEEPIYGSNDTDFREYCAPGVVIAIVFFITLSSSGISIIWDKKLGTLERAQVAGVKTYEVLLAFLLSEGSVLVIQTSLSYLVMRYVLGIEVKGSVFLLLSLIFLVGLSGLSMGFLVSSICQEEIEAVLIDIAVFLPNIVLAGIFWPIIGMPGILYYIAHALPCTLAAESMRSIVSRGWSFSHPTVWPGFATTIGWMSIYCIITVLVYRRSHSNK